MKCHNELSITVDGVHVWTSSPVMLCPICILQPKAGVYHACAIMKGGRRRDPLSCKFEYCQYYSFAFSTNSNFTAVKYIHTLRGVLFLWYSGPYLLSHLLGLQSICEASVPCGGSKFVAILVLTVLIHLQPHHSPCYVYWKLGLILICFYCEHYHVSF